MVNVSSVFSKNDAEENDTDAKTTNKLPMRKNKRFMLLAFHLIVSSTDRYALDLC